MAKSHRRITVYCGALALVLLSVKFNVRTIQYLSQVPSDGDGSGDLWRPRTLTAETSGGRSSSTMNEGSKIGANGVRSNIGANGVDGFSTCLIYMDDNHFLPEWLAYHYQFLPLRRLIVAVDPKSLTSPRRILDRFHSAGLINVTLWQDEDYFHNLDTTTEDCKRLSNGDQERVNFCVYLQRQKEFYYSCMKQLIREGRAWTAFIDTDEVIYVNKDAYQSYRLPNVYPTMMEILEDPTNWNQSEDMRNRACIPMSRIQFGTREMDIPDNATIKAQERLDSNGTANVSVAKDLFTYRWRYHQDRLSMNKTGISRLLPGKSIVDVSQLDEGKIAIDTTNPHRPSVQCSNRTVLRKLKASAFIVHTYIGTFEQYTHRDDSRNKRNQTTFQQSAFDHGPYDDRDFMEWLPNLISKLGAKTVGYLLRGAGQLNLDRIEKSRKS